MDRLGRVDERRQIRGHLLGARARQYSYNPSAARTLLDQEAFIDMLGRQLIEVRMAHVFSPNSALLVPLPFERQSAEHVIDPFAHLAHAPAGPGPQLRRYKIENRNPPGMSALGYAPVEPWEINENDRVGPARLEGTVGQPNEAVKSAEGLEDVAE